MSVSSGYKALELPVIVIGKAKPSPPMPTVVDIAPNTQKSELKPSKTRKFVESKVVAKLSPISRVHTHAEGCPRSSSLGQRSISSHVSARSTACVPEQRIGSEGIVIEVVAKLSPISHVHTHAEGRPRCSSLSQRSISSHVSSRSTVCVPEQRILFEGIVDPKFREQFNNETKPGGTKRVTFGTFYRAFFVFCHHVL